MTRVCVAHDYLTQRGGAERVALALLQSFPGAPVVTSMYDPERTFPGFREHRVHTSHLQDVALFRRDPRLALPLLASAWGRMSITDDDTDVVVASSSGWAHGVSVSPGIRKIVYCHNPARWLYQTDDYVAGSQWRAAGKAAALAPLRKRLARWDANAARSADRYIANSTAVARRIERVYGISAEVLPPPVAVDVDGPRQPVEGMEPGFFLTVARGRGYKNTAVVEEAVASVPGQRLVVVGSGSSDSPSEHPAVSRLGIVSDAQLRWLYANARALVSVSHEDFGLTPLEANAFGTPAVLLRAGGFLDTLDEGVSGVYVEEATAAAVRTALLKLPEFDEGRIRSHADRYSHENFTARLGEIIGDVTGAAPIPSPSRTVDLRTATVPGRSDHRSGGRVPTPAGRP